jgi:hypothetical protein
MRHMFCKTCDSKVSYTIVDSRKVCNCCGLSYMLTAKEGLALQLKEMHDMAERKLWSDKRYFAWFERSFGFKVRS